ncbi:MAG: hypothetical protein LBS23_00580 [Holosporaceae bacterium]|jgi:hypothetical protein|nr:hypothetical protein [Holosporaceae bacterium]
MNFFSFCSGLSFFVGLLLFTSVGAVSVSDDVEDSGGREDLVERESSSHRVGKEAFEGFYLGGGLLKSGMITKTVNVEDRYDVSFPPHRFGLGASSAYDNFSFLCGVVRGRFGGEMVSYSGDDLNNIFDSTAAAASRVNSFVACRRGEKSFLKGTSNKFFGAIVLGYNDYFSENNLFGGEVTLDVCGNKEIVAYDSVSVPVGGVGDVKQKNYGFVPTVALKYGVYSSFLDGLFYLRLGACLVKSGFSAAYGVVKLSKLTPVIGAGFEKNVWDNLSLRVEFDYRIQSEKTGSLTRTGSLTFADGRAAVGGPLSPGAVLSSYTHTFKPRIRTKGYAVRVMGVWYPGKDFCLF